MTISTKSGDDGTTSLWSGERVKKNSLRVDAYGTVDELNSHLAEARHFVKSDITKKLVLEIEDDLFRVGGSLASTSEYKYPVIENDVERINNHVHLFEKKVPFEGFVILGTTLQSAKLDICRTIARRTERIVLTLHDQTPVSLYLIQYLNRMSDLLFIMARFEEKLEGKLTLKKW